MDPIRPARTVPRTAAGIPPAPPGVTLRLDGNQGKPPPAEFFARLANDVELLRSYPLDDTLERALAARHGVASKCIFAGAGADDVLDRLCRAVLEPGREAIVPLPTFPMLERYVALAGARLVDAPWTNGGWPRERVLAAVTPATALIAIVSPNNPTGLVATADDVHAVATAAPHALVLVDAAYAEFGGEDLTRAAMQHANTAVVRTFSKAFGLAGLRVGYTVAQPDVVQWVRAAGSPFTCGAVARAAAVARLRDEANDVAEHVRTIVGEREAFAAAVRDAGADPLPSAGNFVFVRCRDPQWFVAALAGLGIAVRAIAGGVRVTMPGDGADFARVVAAAQAALAPQALLLDLDGVLADIEGRRALASVADVQSLAAKAPLGIVTGCPRRLAESVLARHGFAPFVRTVVASEDAPGKPDPAPVRLALQRLGAERAWMIGDNPGDVVAARAAGVVPLAIALAGIGAESHAAQLRTAGAARLLASLTDVVALVG